MSQTYMQTWNHNNIFKLKRFVDGTLALQPTTLLTTTPALIALMLIEPTTFSSTVEYL